MSQTNSNSARVKLEDLNIDIPVYQIYAIEIENAGNVGKC